MQENSTILNRFLQMDYVFTAIKPNAGLERRNISGATKYGLEFVAGFAHAFVLLGVTIAACLFD